MDKTKTKVLILDKENNFPGNVRELRNMTERAIIFCKNRQLKAGDFQLTGSQSKPVGIKPKGLNLNEVEAQIIKQALDNCNYNQSKASELLGISRDALIRRMRKFNIQICKVAQV